MTTYKSPLYFYKLFFDLNVNLCIKLTRKKKTDAKKQKQKTHVILYKESHV